jgi:hypothetical protein
MTINCRNNKHQTRLQGNHLWVSDGLRLMYVILTEINLKSLLLLCTVKIWRVAIKCCECCDDAC